MRPQLLNQQAQESFYTHNLHSTPRGYHRHSRDQGVPLPRALSQLETLGEESENRDSHHSSAIPAFGKNSLMHWHSALGPPPGLCSGFFSCINGDDRALPTSSFLVSLEALLSLQWWASPALPKDLAYWEPHRLVLTTDASLHGWGAHLEAQMAQGLWTQEDLSHNISWLELFVSFRPSTLGYVFYSRLLASGYYCYGL